MVHGILHLIRRPLPLANRFFVVVYLVSIRAFHIQYCYCYTKHTQSAAQSSCHGVVCLHSSLLVWEHMPGCHSFEKCYGTA